MRASILLIYKTFTKKYRWQNILSFQVIFCLGVKTANP